MPEKTAGPDTRQLRDEKLPQGAFPGDQPQAFRIHFAPEVHAEIGKHAAEDTSIEVCGVLVGTWRRDERGPFVSITASIRGAAAESKHAEVTFTHETWAKINAQMDASYRDLAIVGWYHTHPDFGIFLSERDRFIHEHFFSGAGQLACVIDPVRKLEGVFLWADGKPRLCPFYWVGAELHAGEREEGADRRAEPSSRAAALDTPAAAAVPAPAGGKASITTWVSWLAFALALFLLGYVIAARQASGETRALANFAVMKSARVGLRENLQIVSAQLNEQQALVEELATRHQSLAQATPEAAQIQRSWNELRTRFDSTRQALRLISDEYGISEEETRAIARLLEAQIAAQTGRRLVGAPREAGPTLQPPSPGATPSTGVTDAGQ
jgi:proteasome lid subunit RPN8/RPN11